MEYIDILTKEGEPTGKSVLKSDIHRKGYYHNTAHIWFYTKNGEILLAQRAATKRIKPLLWDVSVAGHVDTDETVTQAAIREIKEEIGISISENSLLKIGVFPCFKSYNNGIIDNEFHHTFITELKVDILKLKPNKDEVEALKLVTITKFNNLLINSKINRHFVESNTAYYKVIRNAILQQMKK